MGIAVGLRSLICAFHVWEQSNQMLHIVGWEERKHGEKVSFEYVSSIGNTVT